MLHTTIPSPWSMDLETQSYMVEAVVRYFKFLTAGFLSACFKIGYDYNQTNNLRK